MLVRVGVYRDVVVSVRYGTFIQSLCLGNILDHLGPWLINIIQ